MISLEYGKYYHIYNRGNNSETLFRSPKDYEHFLKLYEKYIDLIAESFAWVLMKNHFHFLVRIKEENEIGYLPIPSSTIQSSENLDESRIYNDQSNITSQIPDTSRSGDAGRSGSVPRKPVPYRQFSHLFNAYTKYYNKRNDRTGSLFEKNFRRNEVKSEKYFRHLVVYIHNNPVHHGFIDDFKDYPWSSYGTIISGKTNTLIRKNIFGWFESEMQFISSHHTLEEYETNKEFEIDSMD